VIAQKVPKFGVLREVTPFLKSAHNLEEAVVRHLQDQDHVYDLVGTSKPSAEVSSV